MSYKLGGRNSLPYLGVEAPTPPNTLVINRSPTSTDSSNVNLGTFWLVPKVGTNPEELWVLVNLFSGIATWVQLYPGTSGGGASQFIEDVGVANEVSGIINVIGGADPGGNTNINTFGSGNTVKVILNETIHWSNTTSGQGAGAIFLGGNRFLHNFGIDSTFLGSLAGPTTNSSSDNTGIGTEALTGITTGEFNTALGSSAGFAITTGRSNTLLGDLAGASYTTESNNISINNIGTVADNAVIRIGTPGTQLGCYVAGIYGATINTTTAFMVLQDNTSKLGAAQITSTGGTIVITKGAGTINFDTSSSGGLDGSSFMAYVNPSEVVAGTGTQTTFFVGATQAMNILYDNFGTFNVGPVAGGAFFTVPVRGYYLINLIIDFVGGQVGSDGTTAVLLFKNGTPISSNFSFNFAVGGVQTFGTVGTFPINITLPLNVGDVLTFGINIGTASATTPSFGGVNGSGPYAGAFKNWISGILLKTF